MPPDLEQIKAALHLSHIAPAVVVVIVVATVITVAAMMSAARAALNLTKEDQ